MKKVFNGNSMKFARQYRSYSVEELAELIGVTRQAVSQYENTALEKEKPSFERILKIASVLNFPLEFFYTDDVDYMKVNATYFRALLGSSKKEKTAQVNRAMVVTAIYQVLKQYIQFPKLTLPKRAELVTEATIKQKAQELRNIWNIKNKPIEDIVFLMEDNGILVNIVSNEEKGIDAYTQYTTIDGEEIMCVTLENQRTSAARLQFSAAHELGHILLHGANIDLNDIDRSTFRKMEEEANLFASELLLPEEEFKKDLILPTNLKGYEMLKKKWKVSIGAMMLRALNLKIITKNQYQYLIKQYNYNKYRDGEPLDDVMAIPEPQALKRATEMLLVNNVFSESEFVNEMQENAIYINEEEIEKIIGLEPGTLKKKEKNNVIEFKIVKRKRI